MHDNFWVHRDVKLANIVRCLNGSWMLIDLDLAEKLDPATNEAPWPFFDRPGIMMKIGSLNMTSNKLPDAISGTY